MSVQQDIEGAGRELQALQNGLVVSDGLLLEIIGLEPTPTRMRRFRSWKEDREPIPTNHLLSIKRLNAMARAVKFIEDGEWDSAADVLRMAMPEVLL